MRDNKFGPLGCFYIQVYAFRNLIHLNLSKNNIQNEGVEKLCAASYFRNITKLYLDDNNLTANSGKYLAESSFLTKITHLSLGFNSIGDIGI